jgi:hypothetical protein
LRFVSVDSKEVADAFVASAEGKEVRKEGAEGEGVVKCDLYQGLSKSLHVHTITDK